MFYIIPAMNCVALLDGFFRHDDCGTGCFDAWCSPVSQIAVKREVLDSDQTRGT